MQKLVRAFAPRLVNHLKNSSLHFGSLLKIKKLPLSTKPNSNDSKNLAGLSLEDKQKLEFVEAGVFELLKNSPKCKQDKLSRTAGLEDLGFDSLDVVELVIAVEEKFNITISGKVVTKQDDDSVKIQSVNDMIQMFFNYLTGRVKSPEPVTEPSGHL